MLWLGLALSLAGGASSHPGIQVTAPPAAPDQGQVADGGIGPPQSSDVQVVDGGIGPPRSGDVQTVDGGIGPPRSSQMLTADGGIGPPLHA